MVDVTKPITLKSAITDALVTTYTKEPHKQPHTLPALLLPHFSSLNKPVKTELSDDTPTQAKNTTTAAPSSPTTPSTQKTHPQETEKKQPSTLLGATVHSSNPLTPQATTAEQVSQTPAENLNNEFQELVKFLKTLKQNEPELFKQVDELYYAKTQNTLPTELDDFASFIALNEHLSCMFDSVHAFSDSLFERFVLFVINLFSSDNVKEQVQSSLNRLTEQLLNLPIPTYKDEKFLKLIESIARDCHNEVLTTRYRNHIKNKAIKLIKDMHDARCRSPHNQLGGDELLSLTVSYYALTDANQNDEFFKHLCSLIPYSYRGKTLPQMLNSFLSPKNKPDWNHYFKAYDEANSHDEILTQAAELWHQNPMLPHERIEQLGFTQKSREQNFMALWEAEQAYWQDTGPGVEYKLYSTLTTYLQNRVSSLNAISGQYVSVEEGTAGDVAHGLQIASAIVGCFCPPAGGATQAASQALELANKKLKKHQAEKLAKAIHQFFRTPKDTYMGLERLSRTLSFAFTHYLQVVYHTEPINSQKKIISNLLTAIWDAALECMAKERPHPLSAKEQLGELVHSVLNCNYVQKHILNHAILVSYDANGNPDFKTRVKPSEKNALKYYIPKFYGFPEQTGVSFSTQSPNTLNTQDDGDTVNDLEGTIHNIPPGMRTQEEIDSFTGVCEEDPNMLRYFEARKKVDDVEKQNQQIAEEQKRQALVVNQLAEQQKAQSSDKELQQKRQIFFDSIEKVILKLNDRFETQDNLLMDLELDCSDASNAVERFRKQPPYSKYTSLVDKLVQRCSDIEINNWATVDDAIKSYTTLLELNLSSLEKKVAPYVDKLRTKHSVNQLQTDNLETPDAAKLGSSPESTLTLVSTSSSQSIDGCSSDEMQLALSSPEGSPPQASTSAESNTFTMMRDNLAGNNIASQAQAASLARDLNQTTSTPKLHQ